MTTGITDRTLGLLTDVAIKSPCRVATTANITLSGLQTIDGVTVVANDRVLVKDQTTGTDNGIYRASATAWSRDTDFDGNNDVVQGTMAKVTAGTTNGGSIGEVTTTGPILIGTTSITFAMRTGTLAAVSAFIGTLLPAADAAAARTTLGITANGTAASADTGTSGHTVPFLDGANTWSGVQTHSSAVNEAKGADIASATTTNIGAASGNYVNVTGTTPITGLGTVQAGTRRIVNFTGILTLTHNGTSLILPGGVSITTAAGDIGTFVSLGSGNWVCTNYTKANGTSVVSAAAGALTFLSAQTASTSAALTFTSLISSTYNKFLLEFDDIILATNPATLTVQVSTDNGANWKSSGYLNNFVAFQSGSPSFVTPTTAVQVAFSSSSAVPTSGQAWFANPNSTANVCMFNGNVGGVDTLGAAVSGLIVGWYNTTGTAINAVRLIASSGNITSGVARLYGLQKS